ncbi:glycerophosphodiester phosphodiesterase GDPD6-like isoform X2 [Rhododendron vialii]|uniref:glycerophosphodiester phosphodiesterase GDPD6-like isoform X2 n=1 Tax=Rhododendron vialii TaxID=182163 RepID=UPI00265DB35D|nr:glycerophosphodiester phosphodiesterase GDPD6-like isoform X2 [Rhododendron vialii]
MASFGVVAFIFLILLVECYSRPLYPLPSKTDYKNRQPLQTFRPYNIAHRGSNGEIPEETAAAYMRAIEEGADFIETDILSSKDGVLICFHDVTLDDTTDIAEHKEFANRKRTYDVQGVNTTGYFTVDFTLEELKTLRVKQRYPFRDQQYNGKFQIITFEEYISIALDASRIVGIYPEIKNPVLINQHVKWSGGKRFEDKFVEMLKKYGYKGSYLSKDWLKQPAFIQSFAPTSLIYVSNQTDLPKILLIDDVTVPTQDTNQSYWEITSDAYFNYIKNYVVGIGPWKDTIVPVMNNYLQTPTDLVARAHASNLQVHPYTFRDENVFLHFDFHQDPYNEFEYWVNKMGVDGLFTDFTGSLHQFQEWNSPFSGKDGDASTLLHEIARLISKYGKK